MRPSEKVWRAQCNQNILKCKIYINHFLILLMSANVLVFKIHLQHILYLSCTLHDFIVNLSINYESFRYELLLSNIAIKNLGFSILVRSNCYLIIYK